MAPSTYYVHGLPQVNEYLRYNYIGWCAIDKLLVENGYKRISGWDGLKKESTNLTEEQLQLEGSN